VGKLLTGQDNRGDAKKWMDAVVMKIDARRKIPVFFKISASKQTETHVRVRSGC